ncbi:porin family protein [Rhodohalobacter mucosus]|nr:porin family protein [Rhodohalobacter mucosus]
MNSIKGSILGMAMVLIAGLTAQTNAQSPVSFGLKGGFTIANLAGEDFDADARFGLTAGAMIDISLPVVPFGVESGIYYTQKGARASDGFSGDVDLDYVEVPVLAKFRLGPPGPITPHLVAGPYVSFNINAESETGDISDDINSTEIGGAIGVGIDFNLGVTKLNARAQYGYGFTDVFKNAADGNGGKNAALSVTAGIWF